MKFDPCARLHADGQKVDQRDPGQRDRDRVLYTYALRRLAGVTQVVGAVEGHLFHNRLTHTLEVAQIARRLAEKLSDEQPALAKQLGGINADVVEAAALAHDLGHPPFGHVAEHELDLLARQHGDPDGFEGNAQSFRILTRLAAHSYEYQGINLCRKTLNAVLKYPWLRDLRNRRGKKYKKFGAYRSEEIEWRFARAGFGRSDAQSIEAAIMDHADAVAYSVHDLDDFFRAGLVSVDHLKNSGEQFDAFLSRWVSTGKVTAKEVARARSGLRNLLEDSFYLGERYTGTFLQRAELRTVTSNLIRDYVYAASLEAPSPGGSGLRIDPAKALEMKFLQRIVWDFVISNPRLATQQHGQRRVIRSLFEMYLAAITQRDPDLLPALFHTELEGLGARPKRARKPTRAEIRLAVDVVASFTDNQAMLLNRRLTGVTTGSVADLLEG